MRPETVRVLAQVVRHSRGILTALEQWLASQPTEPTIDPGPPPASRNLRLASHGHPEPPANEAKGF